MRLPYMLTHWCSIPDDRLMPGSHLVEREGDSTIGVVMMRALADLYRDLCTRRMPKV